MFEPAGYSSDDHAAALKTLAADLLGEFDAARHQRLEHEQRWLDDLRQYRGVYSAEELAGMGKNRARIFMNLTKQKVDSTKARLMSLLFPSTSDENWSIQATPEPDLPEEVLLQERFAAMKEGREIREPKMLARERAEKMSRTIADQLAETHGRPNYRTSCGKIIHQALLHGSGILKGPLVDMRRNNRLQKDPRTGLYGLFAVESEEMRPYFETVSIWDCYLDSSISDPEAMRFVWQTHVMNLKELVENLAATPLFDAAAIADHVRENPSGDCTPYAWETELRDMDSGENNDSLNKRAGRYRVYERWGHLSGRQLRDAGVDLPEEDESRTYDAQVWILGSRIIKIAPQPVTGFGLPYQLFYYHKDETSIYGEGLAWALRDPQAAINATVRMLLDNAAITSGPIVGLNVNGLAPGQDPANLNPFKVLLFDNAKDMREAMILWQMTANTPEILKIYDLMSQAADEMSVPRYLTGDNSTLRGAGDTASGLSMLMNAANLTVQDLVRNFDDGITEPFIRSMYLWNMVFNPDESIKGDFDVVAVGSSSLLAKEAEGQKMIQAMNVLQLPQFAGRVKEGELLKDILQKLSLPDHIMRTEDEYREYQLEQAKLAALAQAQAAVQAVVEQGAKQGLPPDAVLREIMTMAAQAAAPATAQERAGAQHGATEMAQ